MYNSQNEPPVKRDRRGRWHTSPIRGAVVHPRSEYNHDLTQSYRAALSASLIKTPRKVGRREERKKKHKVSVQQGRARVNVCGGGRANERSGHAPPRHANKGEVRD